ncbi:hypothetical protein E3P99_02960 [Wallemia hederae]|uniref:Rab-GAP TBC domain-containing protein n=1 Tax=Wallemia hederae TaxID=1540922 RepID=A0A4T0FK98_9BASI|nr:hypothetical protein E3P99_02960 [Wallemia hederae]
MGTRLDKFNFILNSPVVDIEKLQKLSWSGVPSSLRCAVWPLLLGYLPTNSSRRATTLSKKRAEYATASLNAFDRPLDSKLWHQIVIDVPRTNPGNPLWQNDTAQRSLERILYIWSIRHPASGYVQGINDLATPFYQVYLSNYIQGDAHSCDPSLLSATHLQEIEADTFWSLSKLLDGIQDNYIIAQPGIMRQVKRLNELTRKVDPELSLHLSDQGVDFIQFSFRWINCLLMREVQMSNVIRMWDTYLSEGTDSFSCFHTYVCLAFLNKWSKQLKLLDFQDIIMFLQAPPTQSWSDSDVELLLSEAYLLKTVWDNAQSHIS